MLFQLVFKRKFLHEGRIPGEKGGEREEAFLSSKPGRATKDLISSAEIPAIWVLCGGADEQSTVEGSERRELNKQVL